MKRYLVSLVALFISCTATAATVNYHYLDPFAENTDFFLSINATVNGVDFSSPYQQIREDSIESWSISDNFNVLNGKSLPGSFIVLNLYYGHVLSWAAVAAKNDDFYVYLYSNYNGWNGGGYNNGIFPDRTLGYDAETVNIIFNQFPLDGQPFGTYGSGGFRVYSVDNLAAIGWSIIPVPEPDTYAMLMAGLGLISFAKKRRISNA